MEITLKKENILESIFALVLILRFIFPFYYNPIDSLFSDPGRHWGNGFGLLHPGLFNAIDPKLYQIYVFILKNISDEGHNHAVIALATGALCAAFAFFWLCFAKELLPEKHAYILAIMVGLFPSLVGVYAYFMNETIFLTTLALSLWLSFRAMRRNNLRDSIYASISLLLLIIAKLTALPIVIILLAIIFFKEKHKKKFSVFVIIMSALVLIPFSIYNHLVMNIFNPFHFSKENEIYYLSDYRAFSFNTQLGSFSFASPSLFTKITQPLFDYKSPRKDGAYHFDIDLRKGNEDWDKEIEKLKSQQSFDSMLIKREENIIYFLFGPEWPFSSYNDGASLLQDLSFQSRWVWFPSIMLVVITGIFLKTKPEHCFVVFLTTLMIILLMSQTKIVSEGRFRQAIDPLILTSVYLIIYGFLSKGEKANPVSYLIKKFIKSLR